MPVVCRPARARDRRLLLAQSGHAAMFAIRSLSGEKRTWSARR